MKQGQLKSIPVTMVIVASLFALNGCGAKSAAATANPRAMATTAATTATTATTQPDLKLMTSQQQVKAIDIKSTKGQQQLDAQINKNLSNLDKSLSALDKSLGSL